MSATLQYRVLQCCLLLLIMQNLREFLESSPNYQRNFARESKFFPNQVDSCITFFETIEFDHEFGIYNTFNHFSGSFGKYSQIYRFKTNNTKIIMKYRPNALNVLKHVQLPLEEAQLSRLFYDNSRTTLNHFCPPENIEEFVDYFSAANVYNRTITWLYMLTNMELLLLPHLHGLGFPVPKTYAICGLTIFQQFGGFTLQHFYNAHFRVKAQIAKQLLEAVWRFTHDLKNFRIYVTDLTADNLVYNEEEKQLYFVDLDTVMIVEATGALNSSFHKHDYIECNNCFAFSEEQLCRHKLSDLNIFEACLFLRENLKQERSGGFLYPIPDVVLKTYPQLLDLLDECVDGTTEGGIETEETNRFAAVLKLKHIFEEILM